MDDWEISVSEIDHSKLEISRMLNDALEYVDTPFTNNNIINEPLKMSEIVSNISLTKINNNCCLTDAKTFNNKCDLKLQNVTSISQCFELTCNNNNNLCSSVIIKQTINKSLLNKKKKRIFIKCDPQQTIPFIVEGGSEKAQLIYISAVLRCDLINRLNVGDVLLSVDNIYLAGRVLSEVSTFLNTLFYSNKEICFEYIEAGEVPLNIQEILKISQWEELQVILRNNIFLRVVPCTTRTPEPNEINGENYYFISLCHFLELLRNDIFLEHELFEGHFYGTPKPETDIREFNYFNKYSDENFLFNNSLTNLKQNSLIKNSNNYLNNSMVQSDSRGPLPPNWEAAYSENGEKYFIDHNTGTTQWEDPRDLNEISDHQSFFTPTKNFVKEASLPPGWERVDDEIHGTFYVDHINKRTQYEPPFQLTYHNQNGMASSSSSNIGNSFLNDSNSIYKKDYEIYKPNENVNQSFDSTMLNNHYAVSYNNQFNNHLKNKFGDVSASTSLQNCQYSNLANQKYFSNNGMQNLSFKNNDYSDHAIKTILANGPAAINGVLEPGDILVFVNNNCMLGASQDDACRIFRSIPVGETVRIQICRGYPLFLHPSNKIVTENVYMLNNFQPPQTRENFEIELCKGERGFGFTITDSLQGQRVKNILNPECCLNLMENDIIIEVNGQNVRSMPHAKLVEMFKDFQPGQKAKMIISRSVVRHRSQTPTAGFKYGEQRHSTNFINAPRSKTPAPTTSTLPNGGKINGTTAAAINRNNIMQQQKIFNGTSNWSTTIPRTNQNRSTIYSDLSTNGIKPTQDHQLLIQRSPSTALGFSSTPNYIPISALNSYNHYDVNKKTESDEFFYVTVNLVEKSKSFGFHLLSENDVGTSLMIGEIIPNGAAYLDGRLQTGDQLVEIDGQSVDNFDYKTAVGIIQKAAAVGRVKLIVKRKQENNIYGTINNGYNTSINETIQCPILKQNQKPYDVHLTKLDHEDFGISVISQNHRYIGMINPNSPAQRCGQLKAGDCLIAINGLPVYNLSHQQVINLICASGNTLVLTIDPKNKMNSSLSNDCNNEVDKVDALIPIFSSNGISSRNSDSGTLNKKEIISKDNIITVELTRGAKGFGFSIRGGMEFGEMPLFILRIAEDGPAALDGKLQVGDQLIKINNERTLGMTHARAIELITQHQNVRLTVKRPI